MRKLLLVAVIAVAGVFSANAQVGVHLDVTKSLEEGAEGTGIGVDVQYLFTASDAFVVGPEVGFAKVIGLPEGSASVTNLWYQVAAKYYVTGDAETGGFYPQLNVGMVSTRLSADGFSASSTDLQYGLGAGYKLETGIDLSLRYNIQKVTGGSSKSIQIQVGMFF